MFQKRSETGLDTQVPLASDGNSKGVNAHDEMAPILVGTLVGSFDLLGVVTVLWRRSDEVVHTDCSLSGHHTRRPLLVGETDAGAIIPSLPDDEDDEDGTTPVANLMRGASKGNRR